LNMARGSQGAKRHFFRYVKVALFSSIILRPSIYVEVRPRIEPGHRVSTYRALILRKGFFQSAMFLASALKRGRHPPENIMKFNVPGG
jgi:hypothetical protein